MFPRNSPVINTMGYAKLHSACKASIDYLVRKRNIIIGRSGFDADCQIRSDTRAISRHHARLFWVEERQQWAIECISQTNGLIVDGAPLVFGSPALHLRSKNLIEMGDVAFFFLLAIESNYTTPDIVATEERVLEIRSARKRKRAGGGGGDSSRKRKKPPLMPTRPAKRKVASRKRPQQKQSAAADIETDDSSRDSEDEIEDQTLEIDEDEIRPAYRRESPKLTRKDTSSRSSRASPALDELTHDIPSPLPPSSPPEGSTKQRRTKKEPKPSTTTGRRRKKESPRGSRDGLGTAPSQFREEWYKKEKADFFRALNAVGTDPIRDDGGEIIGFDWSRFRRIAELPKKSDAQLRSYYHAVMKDAEALLEEEDREKRTKGPRTKHKPGCECVVCKNTRKSRRKKREENNTAEEAPVVEQNEDATTETKNTGRAGDRLIGLVTAQKLRVRFSIHDALRQVDSPAGTAMIDKFSGQSVNSTDLPDWWVPGRHDRALLLGARKHGVAMWNDIWKDEDCEEFELVREDHGPDVKWPSAQVAMKRLREVVSAINAEIRRLNKKEAKRAETAEKGGKTSRRRGGKREGAGRGGKSKAKKETGTIAKLKATLAKRAKAAVEEAVVGDNENNNNAEDVPTQSEGSRSKGSSRADSEVELEIDDDEDDMVIEEEYDEDPPPAQPQSAEQPLADVYPGRVADTDDDESEVVKMEYETSSETGSE